MTVTRRLAAPRRPIERWEDSPRIDSLEKVTGRAKYIEDLPDLPGLVYAAPLLSPYSHARIVSIDSSKALQLPGVLGVLDRDHLDGLDPLVRVGEYKGRTREHGQSADQHFLTVDKARFDGDFIAMVAATDLRTARRAVELIDVEWEILPTVFSFEEAVAPDAPLIHEDLASNIAFENSFEWGDIEQGFRESDLIFEESYYTPHAFHHPMEPAGSCVVRYANDQADIWVPVNMAFTPRPQVAELFGIEQEAVRVRTPYLGGSFGAKPFTPAMLGALALSRRIGHPIKLVAKDDESFRVTARHAADYRAKIGVKQDGTIVALDVKLDADTGAYFTGASTVAHTMIVSSWGCYRWPHFRVKLTSVYTNTVPCGAFRGTGKSQTTFGIEALMDKVARQIGMTPVEFRKKNVLLRGEYVADTWRVRGKEYAADTPPMDSNFHEIIDRATKALGWDGSVTDRSKIPDDQPKVRGRGLALSFRHGSHGSGRAYAMASVDSTGIVRIAHAAPELGEGTLNMLTIVSAKTLGLPLDQVKVDLADTIHDLTFEGSAAQRTTVVMGNAVQSACEGLRRELCEAAAQLRGGAKDDWRVENGRVCRGEESYGFGELIRAFEIAAGVDGEVRLKGLGTYSYAPSDDKAFGGLDHWAPGCVAVEVEVDRETGDVEILQISTVADAGKALHYPSARGQAESGTIMGLGLALAEQTVYQDEQFQNGDTFQYRLPRMSDLPDPEHFAVWLIENGDGPGPFGSKGMAQTAVPCVTPAIANAVYDAVGVQVTSAPVTPEKILRAIGKLGG